ncbi:hypothetical protein ABW21_db0207385 [Orbilia brochopaga]|nr:hypothetical protein ABW21_db0207385 [Drechslerella brochopaga]
MYTNAYNSGNAIVHPNAVNPPGGVNGTDSTTILVRLAPDVVTIDIPFNRVTTWKRLMQTLFEIYQRNNPMSTYLSLDDAFDCIQIRNDLTGGIILPELWSDFIKPQVRISAHFHPPFLNPPWDPASENEIQQEDNDIEMMEGVVGYAIESKIGGLIEAPISTTSWSKPVARLLGPALSKEDEQDAFLALPPPLHNFLTPLSFTSCTTSTWAPLEPEKIRARVPIAVSRSSATAIISTTGEPMLLSATMTPEPIADPMRDISESPQPSITFRDPFAQQTTFAGPPSRVTPPAMPQRFSPIRTVPASSDPLSRPPSKSPISPEATNHPAGASHDPNPRPSKRKREERASLSEGPRKSKSPFPSTGSNGHLSRAVSIDVTEHTATEEDPAATGSKIGEICFGKSVVIHSKIMLLDTITAGDLIKVIKTLDGEFIAIKDNEEPEDIIERRRRAAIPPKKDKETEAAKTAKKRAHDEANTEELIRIWSGGGPEPPAKKPKANVYDKLTIDHKLSIAKFVSDQHIIRVDHFTGPVIQEWKTSNIPDADMKQCEEYIEEIAATKYDDTAKRKEAYRLFMEHHDHCHKSTSTRTSESPDPIEKLEL